MALPQSQSMIGVPPKLHPDPGADYATIVAAAEAEGLLVMGAVQDAAESGTLILLGTGRGFWELFQSAPESGDAAPDPIDRWSLRVIGALARLFGAQPRFPFGGPPYEPFIAWALASGRAFQSPVGMLVHDQVGMMISYRGALLMPAFVAQPDVGRQSPCLECSTQPCLTTCPVGALGDGQQYDVAKCHAFLDTAAGRDCMENGCKVRRACPVSLGAGRNPAQSSQHMRSFHRG